MKKNYFLINRSLFDHWLWKDKPFARGQAWIDLIGLATHTECKSRYHGELIDCKRGDVNVSMLELSKRWGWSRGKVRRFLDELEMNGMCTVNATTHRTIVTIENYEFYQNERATNGQQTDNKRTTNGQQTDNKRTTNGQQADINKEDRKKVKEDINKYIIPPMGEFANVNLTEEELVKLKERYPYDWQERIERLSAYMQSKGKRYKSHYATILNWAKRDEEKSKSVDFMDL